MTTENSVGSTDIGAKTRENHAAWHAFVAEQMKPHSMAINMLCAKGLSVGEAEDLLMQVVLELQTLYIARGELIIQPVHLLRHVLRLRFIDKYYARSSDDTRTVLLDKTLFRTRGYIDRYVEDAAEAAFERDLLYKSVKMLPTNEQSVLQLNLSGYSIAEIAEYMNMTEGNVRVVLHRGRNRVKALLMDNRSV
ncbi:MAG: sigma-70 family RNA polymerase sigma factor [Patescibacteria group bacterium]|jgi:RNA polymerase sigma factor (sigma-70 family)